MSVNMISLFVLWVVVDGVGIDGRGDQWMVWADERRMQAGQGISG